MSTTNSRFQRRYPAEMRERAIRMVHEAIAESGERQGASDPESTCHSTVSLNRPPMCRYLTSLLGRKNPDPRSLAR
jgi:hypothetical protein